MLWNSSERASKMCEFHNTLQLPDVMCNSEDISSHSPIRGALLYSTCSFAVLTMNLAISESGATSFLCAHTKNINQMLPTEHLPSKLLTKK